MNCSQCGLLMTERDGVYLCFCCGNHFLPPIPAPEYSKVVEICRAMMIPPDLLIKQLQANSHFVEFECALTKWMGMFFDGSTTPKILPTIEEFEKAQARQRSRDDVAKKRKESRKRRGKL